MKRKYLIALISQMKYLIIGLNFLVENPQAPLENTIRPCDSAPLLKENLGVPCRKSGEGGGGGHYGHINKGWLFIGRFKVGSLPRMIHKEMLAQFIYKPT